MSLMLGPIHTWLFNKILIAEERAMAIAKGVEVDGGSVGDLLVRYGEPLAGQDLGDLVGDRGIHPFLQGLITKIQVFEASLVERSPERIDLIMQTAYHHGKEVANRLAPDPARPCAMRDISDLLHNTQLEGMPCDPGATFTRRSDDDGFEYTHSACNHMDNWGYTGVDTAVMCRLTNRWIAGFVEELGGSYDVSSTIADGAPACFARVVRKS